MVHLRMVQLGVCSWREVHEQRSWAGAAQEKTSDMGSIRWCRKSSEKGETSGSVPKAPLASSYMSQHTKEDLGTFKQLGY